MATISPLQAALPLLEKISDTTEFFGAAKRKFGQYLNANLYQKSQTNSLFIYRVQRPHRSHTGILACANVQDYVEGNIKKHENTLTAKEDKMLGLFYERNAMIKPILLTYPNALEIDALINRITVALPPSFSIPFEDETHVFWQITHATQIAQLINLFKNHVPTTYICDGHHRAASSERMYQDARAHNPLHNGTEPYNFMLAAYFPASEIEVHNYNRYILDIGMPYEDFLKRIEEYCYVLPQTQQYSPIARNLIGMYLNKQWFKLEIKEKHLPNPKKFSIKERLDVQLLNQYVFQNILGSQDVRVDANIQYVEGPAGHQSIQHEVDKATNGAGFVMYPVALEDLMGIAKIDGTMPPKSTWIEPRMRNGFVAQLYEPS